VKTLIWAAFCHRSIRGRKWHRHGGRAHHVIARCRNAIIWPRVTIDRGQKVLAVQPVVIPEAANLLMSFSWTERSSSVK
jgi:hypothetical protein